MSAKASDEELRGQGSRVQRKEEATAEGLGGSNIAGFDDPRTFAGLPDVSQPKKSDPEWVERKEPESLPNYTTGVKGVGYDPGSATVAMVDVPGAERSSGASASQTGLLPKSHEIGGKEFDPQTLGAVGADTSVGGAGTGAGPKQRDRAAAGADYLESQEGYGKSIKQRVKAGTEGGVQGEEKHKGFDIHPPGQGRRDSAVEPQIERFCTHASL